uniref:Uncharacterized protein n=1 Tax=Brugia malayi TaxID=6279 RepID=A8NMU4_BRUMA
MASEKETHQLRKEENGNKLRQILPTVNKNLMIIELNNSDSALVCEKQALQLSLEKMSEHEKKTNTKQNIN